MIKRLILYSFFLILSIHLHAQNLLSESRRNSNGIIIYKTDSTFLRNMHYKQNISQQDITGTEITRYRSGEPVPHLAKGEHIFHVALSPRFSGKYTINPAKAELMYHPVFFGNNQIKTLKILE